MPRLTIQAIQERHPWIMRPVTLLDTALTPRRWMPAPLRDVATRLSNALTRDSSGAARALARLFGWVPRLRAALLRGRPGLQRAAWRLRQQIWAGTWTFIIVSRLWPRRTPVPREDDVDIRLIAAPESYEDFRSPALVVPSDVPYGEMSLPGAMTVQLLHVMQDVYPIVTSHQPDAPSDPDERLRQAFPWLFRMVRQPPVWHPDLERARREGRLLDALALGGPFAKLLERSDACEYQIDLEYLRGYPVRPGLARLGARIRYQDLGTTVKVKAIELNGQTVTPGDTRWPLAERIALCSLGTHTTVWRHGMQYHVGGVAPFAVATHALPPSHPLRRLMAPHMADTLSTNFHTHLTLRRSGFDVTGFSFNYDTILRYYDDGARYFDLRRLDATGDSSRRGIGDDLEYPHRDQSARYMALFESYVREYIGLYYPDEPSLQQDAAARRWFETLDRQVVRGITSVAPAFNRDSLARLCALFIYSVSVEHEDNTLWNYMMFLPATVREDGGCESLGQLQTVVNFEMLIASATNRLMNDSSHVALDPAGAAVMRRFQERLRALEQQMETEPDRYWRILPSELEASVSA